MKKEELLDVLNKSLSMEKEGYQFYTEGAKKIKNSLGRKMLERLANDELTHIKRIKELYSVLTGESDQEIEMTEAKETSFDEIFGRMKEQMKESADELGEVGVDDEEIINVAIELETHARFFYSESAEKADDERVKKFYQMLAKEEQSHYDALRKTNSYLENPSLFYGMGYH